MEPPHPYWAHHDHSDKHLNLLFAPYPQESEPPPPHPYWTDHDHDHDRSHEHLNVVYPTVRELRSFYPPSPDDSGYFSPSETRARARRWKLRVVNITPPPASPFPPSPPPAAATTTSLLFAEQEEDEGGESRNFPSRDLSSGWSASSSGDSTSTIVRVKAEEKNKKKNKKKRSGAYSSARQSNNNICSRALRGAARKCIGKKVLAAKRMMTKISPRPTGSSGPTSRLGLGTGIGVGTGTGTGIGFGETDGAAQEAKPTAGGRSKKGVPEPWVRVGVLERIKRTLLRKKGPLELKRAEVRFPLD